MLGLNASEVFETPKESDILLEQILERLKYVSLKLQLSSKKLLKSLCLHYLQTM
jgi:hypothetical protein